MDVPMISDEIQIKIQMQNPSQEPPDSSKVQNQDLKEMDILYSFDISIGSQNFQHRSNKNKWLYSNQDPDTKPQEGNSCVLQSPKSGL